MLSRFFRFLILALALSPMAAMAANLVNINTAGVATLRHVKGLNTARANAIVEYRETNGRFTSVNQLVRVRGIGSKTLEKVRPHVTVGKTAKTRHHPHHY
ncbi:MAG: helix-hairpin-helix domain-containing protein [Azoarcus sp.]|jgi:competence protein ComEA|nr:helix-hairpin-helix domain-containing protein [Azoarcus sp.]